MKQKRKRPNEEIRGQFLVLQLVNSLENVCAERSRKPDYRQTLFERCSPFIKQTGYRRENALRGALKHMSLRSFRSRQLITRDNLRVHQQLAQLSHKTIDVENTIGALNEDARKLIGERESCALFTQRDCYQQIIAIQDYHWERLAVEQADEDIAKYRVPIIRKRYVRLDRSLST